MLSEADAKKLVDEVYDQQQFTTFRNTREAWDKIRWRDRAAKIPEYYADVGLGDYRSYEAQYAEDIVLQEMGRAAPAYETRSRSLKADRREGAQNFEHFINRQWVIWNEHPCSILVAADQASRGAGAYKLDLRSSPDDIEEDGEEDGEKKQVVWPDRPKSRNGQTPEAKELNEYKLRAPTPFTLERVDIMTLAWMEDTDGIAYVVEKSERQLNAVLSAYGFGVDSQGRLGKLGSATPLNSSTDTNKRVKWAELCTRDRIYHFAEQTDSSREDKWALLGDYPNPFGAVRYVLASGRLSGAADVDRRYRPLIEASYEIAEQDSDFGTIRRYAAFAVGFPVWDVVTDGEGVPYIDPQSGQPMAIYVDPFKPTRTTLPDNTHLQARTIQAGVDLDKMQGFVENNKRRYGPQDVLSGGTAGEREAAWSLATRGERAEYGIGPGLRGQQTAMREIARLVAYCVKNYIKEDVLLWTVVTDQFGQAGREQVKVKPDDIEEDFDIDVDMRYSSTAIQLAKQEAMRRAKDDGDISRLRFQEEALGIDDPAREDAQIALEKLEQATDMMALWEGIEGVIVSAAAETGGPPPSPDKIAALRAAVFGIDMPSATEARRPASPIRTTAEAPPTPTAARPQ